MSHPRFAVLMAWVMTATVAKAVAMAWPAMEAACGWMSIRMDAGRIICFPFASGNRERGLSISLN